MIIGDFAMPKMKGEEVSPGVFLLDEPVPVPGTNKLRALADVGGALCLIELSVKFGQPQKSR